MNDNKNQTNLEINQVISQPYKYGFQTQIEMESFPSGINEEIIQLITEKKNEPEFLRTFRQKAFKKWKQMKTPNWANLQISPINYDAITYYSIPKKKKKLEENSSIYITL